jgi:hypothetical protein
MKKYVLLFALLTGAIMSHGQDLDNIKKMLLLKQYDKAKPELDAFLSKNPTNAEALYYKAYVYQNLGMGQTRPVAESKNLYIGAFDALQKYAQADAKATLTAEEKNATLYNVYYGFYDLGVKTYNEKNFAESFDNFKRALEVHDYIYNRKLPGAEGMKFTAHDTDVVWNLAVLANELKDRNSTMKLILKYKKEKNAELFNKYIVAAKSHYPVDLPYWENQEIEFALSGLEDEALLTKYEELSGRYPNNYVIFYNYAIEIDKFLNSAAAKDVANYRKKQEDAFKKALAIKSTVEVNLQLANMYYSRSYDIQEKMLRIKGTKPAEMQAKKDLEASLKASMQQSIPYAEEAVKQLAALTTYKFSDKANYKLALDILSNAYKATGNAAKSAEYEAKKAQVDKL